MSARITDRSDWYDLWYSDVHCMLDVMHSNMIADIEAGYSTTGECIKKQQRDYDNYKENIDVKLMMFAAMSDEEVNRWCFFDLLKRGAIE